MKAVVVSAFGEPEVLVVEERDKPVLQAGEVLIKVCAAGVNRPDLLQRKGKYPAPIDTVQDILGLEVAGHIVELSDDVSDLSVGERVMALVAGGGYAEYVSVSASVCISIPENVTYEEAAGMPETLFTVWHNVFQRGHLQAGESLLVHGGAGGIGSTAIQLGNLFGAKVFATVGSDAKKVFVNELGAFQAINYHEEDFEEILKDQAIDVILDSIGGSYFNRNIQVLNADGRLVYINAMEGAKVELNLLKLMQKRIYLTGSTLRSRSIEFKSQLAQEIRQHVLPFIEDRCYRTHIHQVFPFQEAAEAHNLMESRNFLGKIILKF